MSKIGNHLVELQETADYQFGWQIAERGEPLPVWNTDGATHLSVRLFNQQTGWHDCHNWERQP